MNSHHQARTAWNVCSCGQFTQKDMENYDSEVHGFPYNGKNMCTVPMVNSPRLRLFIGG